jgi:hypothetical protein
METLPGFDPQSVQKRLERSLIDYLSLELLDCPGSRRLRILESSGFGIVQFNSLPVDTPAENGMHYLRTTATISLLSLLTTFSFSTSVATCSVISDPANACLLLDGITEVYYKPNSDADIIEWNVRSATKSFLDSNPNVLGLARSRYDGPDLTNPPGIITPDPGPETAVESANLSTRAVLTVALTSVGFVVAVGLVTYFRMRKSARMHQVPYISTLENESSHDESSPSRSGEESPSVLSSGDNPGTSFPSILPSSYRVDSPLNSIAEMGTIPESDVSDSGIVLSEGYSTSEESSVEFPFFESTYMIASPVLGARPRTEEELEESL